MRALLRGLPEALEGLAPALAVAATAAFLLLGLLIRAGPAFPAGSGRELVLGGALTAGVVAYNLAFLLAALLLAVAVWRSWERDPRLASLLLGVLALSLGAPVLTSLPGFSAVHVSALLAPLLVLAVREWQAAAWPRRAFLAGLAGLYASLVGVALLSVAGAPGSAVLLTSAEIAALAVALVSPWALGCRRAKIPLALAGVAAAVFLLVSRSSMFPLIVMWGSSLSLHLPIPLYAAAVAALVYVFADRLRAEGLRGRSVGLLLLVLAGLRLGSSYEVLLAAVGVVWLLAPPLGATAVVSPVRAAEASTT